MQTKYILNKYNMKINCFKVNFKKIIGMILVLMISLSLMQTKAFAATAGASISAGSTTIKAGDTTTISVSVSSAETYALRISASGGILSGTTDVADAPGSEVSKNVMTATFKADSAGTYTISLTGEVASSEQVDNDKKSSISKSIKITVNAKEEQRNDAKQEDNTPTENDNSNKGTTSDPKKDTVPAETKRTEEEKPKSSNNSLKSLSVSVGKLSPSFDRATTDYEVEFADDFNVRDLTSITVNATKEDSKAKISGTGSHDLSEGDNYINIDVTAENGAKKTYTIKVTKPKKIEQSDLRIKTLEVNKIDDDNNFIKATLDKDFDPETFEYSLNVEKNIKALDVDAKVDTDGIIVKIDGIDNLKEGENKATITLSSSDDDSLKTVYTINVNKEKSEENENVIATNENPDKKFGMLNYKAIIIGFIALIVVLVIVLITLLIINKKRSKLNLQNEEIDDEDDTNEDDAKAFWSSKVNDDTSDNTKDIFSGYAEHSNKEDNEDGINNEDNKNDISDEEEANAEPKSFDLNSENRNSENEEWQEKNYSKPEKRGKHKGKHF